MNEDFRLRFLDSRSVNLKSKSGPADRNLKWVWLFAICVALTVCGAKVEAQQPTKVARIGYLSATSPSTISARTDSFRQGMRALGYVEGENIVIEHRYAEGKLDRLTALAADLVRLKADVIVTTGPTVTRPAKDATLTIPIVMAFDDDPVGSGFVTSLARPGGNITGLSTLAPELSGKQIEFLKEMVHRLSRVAVLGSSTRAGTAQALKETKRAAEAFGVKVQYLDVPDAKEIATAFRAATKGRNEAILVLQSAILNPERKQIAALAAKNRLPAIYYSGEFVDDGGLMSYGVSITDLFRRAATYVDKILKGTKAADIPVEQPTKFELVINLKAAKQIGLTIPPNVLARADRVTR